MLLEINIKKCLSTIRMGLLYLGSTSSFWDHLFQASRCSLQPWRASSVNTVKSYDWSKKDLSFLTMRFISLRLMTLSRHLPRSLERKKSQGPKSTTVRCTCGTNMTVWTKTRPWFSAYSKQHTIGLTVLKATGKRELRNSLKNFASPDARTSQSRGSPLVSASAQRSLQSLSATGNLFSLTIPQAT